MIRVIGKTLSVLVTAVLLGIVLLLLSTMFSIPGNVEVKIVKSGSMEPAIQTGAVIVTKPVSTYRVGDVITFANPASDIPTTHRIVNVREENGRQVFVTKGDANEEEDAATVALRDVYGKVFVDIPYAGYVLDFSRQPLGFVLLIGLPAFLIILDELVKIWTEVKRIRGRQHRDTQTSRPAMRKMIKEDAFTLYVAPRDEVVAQETEVSETTKSHRMIDIGRPATPRVSPSESKRAYSFTPKRPISMAAIVLVFCLLSSTAIFGFGGVDTTLSYPVDVETSVDNRIAASADFNEVEQLTQLNALLKSDVSGTRAVLSTETEGDTDIRNGRSAAGNVTSTIEEDTSTSTTEMSGEGQKEKVVLIATAPSEEGETEESEEDEAVVQIRTITSEEVETIEAEKEASEEEGSGVIERVEEEITDKGNEPADGEDGTEGNESEAGTESDPEPEPEEVEEFSEEPEEIVVQIRTERAEREEQ